jgi:hypothetical protein
MTKVIITPERPALPHSQFRAAARGRESVGSTPGSALDALAGQLDESETNSFVVVQNLRPDEYFTAAQQQRLGELLAARRHAQDQGKELEPAVQAELEALIEVELEGATKRTAAMLKELQS